MESKTTFVWAESGVELDAISAVDLGLKLVIFPDDTELDDPLGNRNDMEGFLVFRVLFEKRGIFEGGGQLWKTKSQLIDREISPVKEVDRNREVKSSPL
jgi:hypothetical protein